MSCYKLYCFDSSTSSDGCGTCLAINYIVLIPLLVLMDVVRLAINYIVLIPLLVLMDVVRVLL